MKDAKKNIPMRFGTHPSFGERMINFGITDFTVNFNQTDAEYAEAKKCFELADNIVLDDINDSWEINREDNYLLHKKNVEDYEEGKVLASIDIADAYYNLCCYDECLVVLDKILEENQGNSEALFKKGSMLASRFDDRCQGCFLKAVEKDIQWFEPVYEVFGKYMLYMGDVDKVNAIRAWNDQKCEEAFALIKFYAFVKKKDFSVCDLDSKTTERIRLALKQLDITSCTLIKAAPYEKPLYFAFLIVGEVNKNITYNEASAILGAEEKTIIPIFVEIESRTTWPKIYKVARKAKLYTLFTSEKTLCLKNIYRKRIKSIDGVTWLISYSIFAVLGLVIFCIGGSLSDAGKDIGLLNIINTPLLAIGGALFAITLIVFLGKFLIEIFTINHAKRTDKTMRTIFEFDCEYSDDKHEKIEHFLSSSGYTLDGDIYKRCLMSANTCVCLNIAIKQENNKTIIKAFLFKVRKLNPIEHGLSGIILMSEKRALRKTTAVILELLDAPNEMKI